MPEQSNRQGVIPGNPPGTLRETFFYNQLHYLTFSHGIAPPEIRLPKAGDFVLLDKFDRYVFELGGPGKIPLPATG